MRKKLYISALVIAFAAGGLVLGSRLEGAGATPGGPGDPLVSQSYVDMRFNELAQLMAAGVGQVNMEIITSEVWANISTFIGDGANASFEPVFVAAGGVLRAGEGTEIILRSGTAAAHVPGPDGIVNATSGQDLAHGVSIAANNLLIIPRDDGRGVLAVQDSWFIVRGAHTILPAQ